MAEVFGAVVSKFAQKITELYYLLAHFEILELAIIAIARSQSTILVGSSESCLLLVWDISRDQAVAMAR